MHMMSYSFTRNSYGLSSTASQTMSTGSSSPSSFIDKRALAFQMPRDSTIHHLSLTGQITESYSQDQLFAVAEVAQEGLEVPMTDDEPIVPLVYEDTTDMPLELKPVHSTEVGFASNPGPTTLPEVGELPSAFPSPNEAAVPELQNLPPHLP